MRVDRGKHRRCLQWCCQVGRSCGHQRCLLQSVVLRSQDSYLQYPATDIMSCTDVTEDVHSGTYKWSGVGNSLLITQSWLPPPTSLPSRSPTRASATYASHLFARTLAQGLRIANGTGGCFLGLVFTSPDSPMSYTIRPPFSPGGYQNESKGKQRSWSTSSVYVNDFSLKICSFSTDYCLEPLPDRVFAPWEGFAATCHRSLGSWES